MRPDRSLARRTGRGLAGVLLCVLAAGAPAYAHAATGPAGSVLRDPDPAISDGDTPSPSDQPSPSVVATPPDSPTPTDQPPPTWTPKVGVTVTTTNATLGAGYWTGLGATAYTVTAVNTGNVTESVTLHDAPPAGVSDAGGDCPGGCTFTLAPNASHTVRLGLTVTPDAWTHAPLTGSLSFSASADGASPASGTTSWGVVFPPGPPTPGINLHVPNVTLTPQSSSVHLTVTVKNTGSRTASGSLTVVVPSGVTFASLPDQCVTRRSINAASVQCGIGSLAAGAPSQITFPLKVSSRARAEAPLAGLVRASLTPDGQPSAQTQSSYQILAGTGPNGVTAGATSAPASPTPDPESTDSGVDGLFDRAANFVVSGPPAIVWPIIGTSLAALFSAIAGIVYTLQRRRREDLEPEEEAGEEPVTERDDRTAVISAGPVDRTPTPRGPIEWEWTPGTRESDAPPGEPAGRLAIRDDAEPGAEPDPGPDEMVPST